MKIEDVDGELRNFADRLFDLVEQVGGSRPEPLENGYYKGHHQGNGFVYLRLVGDAARKYHRGSVHLHTGWDDRLAGELVRREKNWHGGTPSADLNARPTDPREVALAEEFVRAAFRVHGVTAYWSVQPRRRPAIPPGSATNSSWRSPSTPCTAARTCPKATPTSWS